MITWEYRVITVAPATDAELGDMLNKLGADGWEVASVVRGRRRIRRLFLKRRQGADTVAELLGAAVSIAAAERHDDQR